MQKPFKISTAPVWILAITAIFRLALTMIAMMSFYHFKKNTGAQGNIFLFFWDWFFVLLVVVEAVIYWRIRNKIYNKSWVLAHILLMLVPMVIIPLVFGIVPFFLSRNYNGARFGSIVIILTSVRFYLFWGCFIAGNIFFVAIILKSYRFKQDLPDKEAGILDEYS